MENYSTKMKQCKGFWGVDSAAIFPPKAIDQQRLQPCGKKESVKKMSDKYSRHLCISPRNPKCSMIQLIIHQNGLCCAPYSLVLHSALCLKGLSVPILEKVPSPLRLYSHFLSFTFIFCLILPTGPISLHQRDCSFLFFSPLFVSPLLLPNHALWTVFLQPKRKLTGIC